MANIESRYGEYGKRQNVARKIARAYKNNAYRANYWESGKSYGHDKDMKLSREAYTGKSDQVFARDEYKRTHKEPDSIHARSESIRKGNLDEIYKQLKNGDTKHFKNPEMGWNANIDGFGKLADGTRTVSVYWQGDSTDGNETMRLDKVLRGATIPAESYSDGYRTRYRHGDVRVDKDMLNSALSAYADHAREEETNKWADEQVAKGKEAKQNVSTNKAQSKSTKAAKGNVGG